MAYVDYCIYKFITYNSLLHLFRDEATKVIERQAKEE